MTTKQLETKKQNMIIDEVLKIIRKKREASKATRADITRLLTAFKTNNFEPVKQTALYNKHSGEYCELLSIINYNFMPLV